MTHKKHVILYCESCGKKTIHNLLMVVGILTARLLRTTKHYECSVCKLRQKIVKEEHYEKQIWD